MSIKNKQVVGKIKLQIPAQKAAPSQKIGAALGQKGLNIMEFCKSFNDKTKSMEINMPVRVMITAYADKKFDLDILGSPVSFFIKKAIGLEKGSSSPGRSSVGFITWDQIRIIARQKMEQGISARNIEEAAKIIAGSARSIGIKIIGGSDV